MQTDAVGTFMGRRYGAMLLGYAAIVWLARASGPSPARTAIVGGGAFVATLIALISLAGVMAGTVGPGAWITVIIEGLLASGFLYYFLAGGAQARSETAV